MSSGYIAQVIDNESTVNVVGITHEGMSEVVRKRFEILVLQSSCELQNPVIIVILANVRCGSVADILPQTRRLAASGQKRSFSTVRVFEEVDHFNRTASFNRDLNRLSIGQAFKKLIGQLYISQGLPLNCYYKIAKLQASGFK